MSAATILPIVILVLLLVVMIRISYIVIIASDLVTQKKLAYGRTSTQGQGGRSGSMGDRGGNSHAHHSTMVEPPPTSSESMALSTDEIELFRSVVSRLDTSAKGSFAHLGNFIRSSNS